MSDIDAAIQAKIQSFVSELSALVKQAAVEAVVRALGQGGAPARRTGRRPESRSAAASAPAAKKSGGKRRSPKAIAATVATVQSYIKAHPGERSENIRAALGLPRPQMSDALTRLVDGKKIKRKGEKRAARYTAS